MTDRILVVEDEPMVAEVVERYLRRDGHEVRVIHHGARAMEAYDQFRPDLVVLDLMLPGMDGMEICRQVRQRARTPIIMLTARGEEVDKLNGLDHGADDYITKPFSPRELAARVRAVLRRTDWDKDQPPHLLVFGDLSINTKQRSAEDERGPLRLTAREFDLLLFLATHPAQVFSRDQLMDAVWDQEFMGDASTVTVHMRRLREKVEADPSRPRHLKTVWGVGYKFEP